ncbi:uncharacterized protein B4U79_11799, partial [Dinothrombium tinctorium]
MFSTQETSRSTKTKEYSSDLRSQVISLQKEGKSQQIIAKLLNMPLTSVHYIIQKYNNTKKIENKQGRGRKRKTIPREDREIVRRVKKDKSGCQVVNRLHDAKLHCRSARKKPNISQVNRRKRLLWAKNYVGKDEPSATKLELERKIKNRQPSNKLALKQLFTDPWSKMGKDLTEKLVKSMKKRCLAVKT